MGSTLTSKGQVTIPKPIRDYLGVGPGSKIDFLTDPDGEVVVRAVPAERPRRVRSRAARLRGTLSAVRDTDAWMDLLRDYTADADDPGFGGKRGG